MRTEIIVITDTRTGKNVMRIRAEIRADGTIWGNPNGNTSPVVITSHLPDASELREKYQAAIKSHQIGEIASEHIARIGQIGPYIIETADQEAKRMRPIWKEEAEKREREEKTIIEVYVSSRAWGDYEGIKWRGPSDRPTAQIISECRALMAASNDVDEINQSDADLAAKIEKAKAAAAAKIAAAAKREEERNAAAAKREADLRGLSITEKEEEDCDEGGKTKTYRITVKINGKEWVFLDRNVFDFGRCVNPAYAIAPGEEPGGLGIIEKAGGAYWVKFHAGKGWDKFRDMEADEARAFAAAVNYFGHAESAIRM